MVRIIGPEHCLISSGGVISSAQTRQSPVRHSSPVSLLLLPLVLVLVVLWWCGAVVVLSARHHSTAHRSTAAAAVVKFNRNSNCIGNALLHPAAARMAGVSAQYRIGRVYWLSTVH